MEKDRITPPLPSLIECFINKSTRRSILFLMVSSGMLSFFVTFILSEGLLDPNAFFNTFFKFLPEYSAVILGMGFVWGIVLSFIGVLFRGYLSPRLFLISRPALRAIAIGVCGFVLAFVAVMILYHSCYYFFGVGMWDRDWTLGVALLAGLFGEVFASLLFADYENKLRLQEAENRERDLQRHQLEGQLMNLNLRIRPHFFFNALNTLASLIDKDREAAQEFLADLADMFRKSFTHGQDKPICSWQEEKSILEAYLTVEQMRFMDRLHWDLDVDAPADAPFPAFLLQPLVENAVHHGISPSKSAASMSIEGGYDEGSWHICIRNSIQAAVTPTIEKGHALWTIQERLKLMEGTLELESDEGEFRAILKWRGDNELTLRD